MLNTITEYLDSLLGNPYEYFYNMKLLYGNDIPSNMAVLRYVFGIILILLVIYSIFRIIGKVFR